MSDLPRHTRRNCIVFSWLTTRISRARKILIQV